jgi:hypothetical protein
MISITVNGKAHRLDIEPMRLSVDCDGDHGVSQGVFLRGGRSASLESVPPDD